MMVRRPILADTPSRLTRAALIHIVVSGPKSSKPRPRYPYAAPQLHLPEAMDVLPAHRQFALLPSKPYVSLTEQIAPSRQYVDKIHDGTAVNLPKQTGIQLFEKLGQ